MCWEIPGVSKNIKCILGKQVHISEEVGSLIQT